MLGVDADRAADVAEGRSNRILWTGIGLVCIMLTGISAYALIPDATADSAETLHPFPELAFNPSLPALHRGHVIAGSMALRPAVPGVHQKQSQATLRMTAAEGEPQGTMSIAQVLEKAKQLTPLQRAIAFSETTEKAFTGETVNGYAWDIKDEGTYTGALSGSPVFDSKKKFDARNGWPSFTEAVPGSIIERLDPCDMSMAGRAEPPLSQTFGCDIDDEGPKDEASVVRTEVIDAVSGAHLGHVFNDMRSPSGKRYSINAGAMVFVPSK